MNSTRITSFVICLGLACLMLTGSVLAGTTKVSAEVIYAREVGKANQVYTLPSNTVTRTMGVLRSAGENFFVDVTVSSKSLWDASSPPVVGSLDFNGTETPAIYTVALVGTSADKATAVYSVTITGTGAPTAFPVGTFTATGLKVKDVDNVLGGGGTVTITIATRDLGSGNPIDVGTETDDWLKGTFGVTVSSGAASTTATIDVATARKKFVAGTDSTTVDKGATLGVLGSSATALSTTGTSYTLVAADKVNLVITGDLSGITSVTWDATGVDSVTKSVDATALTNNSLTITIAGGNGSLDGTQNAIWLTVDGTTVLSERTLEITVNLVFPTSGSAGGEFANSRTLVATTTLTKWNLNGTVLIANFQNGNTALFASRIYLFNSSSSAGKVTARLWTLPVKGGTAAMLGSVDCGSIGAGEGLNIKLAEDLLGPNGLGLTLPYTDEGGNVVVEITVEATQVTGSGQVYNPVTLASFGIYSLQKP